GIPCGERLSANSPATGLFFPARSKNQAPFNGWSKSKARLDRACGIKDWSLHDLRRTFATKLAAPGTPIHVTEKLLNHASGIAAVYNRHSYFEEMKAAVAAYESHQIGRAHV